MYERTLLKSKKVLIIDDDEDIREVIRDALEQNRLVEIHEASNGIEAVEKIRELGGQLDLVVSDIRMPGMSGLAMPMKIQELGFDIPLLFVSGVNNDISMSDTPMLKKPFCTWDLMSHVNGLLDSGVAKKRAA